jgi:hypothetical protein
MLVVVLVLLRCRLLVLLMVALLASFQTPFVQQGSLSGSAPQTAPYGNSFWACSRAAWASSVARVARLERRQPYQCTVPPSPRSAVQQPAKDRSTVTAICEALKKNLVFRNISDELLSQVHPRAPPPPRPSCCARRRSFVATTCCKQHCSWHHLLCAVHVTAAGSSTHSMPALQSTANAWRLSGVVRATSTGCLFHPGQS